MTGPAQEQDRTRPRPVLVVDDSDEIRDVVCEVLEAEGYAPVPARNGAEALARLDALAPDGPLVVLLDLMMPTLNGWQFLETLERAGSPVTVGIVVMTGSRQPKLPPGVRWVQKPVRRHELVALVREAFDRLDASAGEASPPT